MGCVWSKDPAANLRILDVVGTNGRLRAGDAGDVATIVRGAAAPARYDTERRPSAPTQCPARSGPGGWPDVIEPSRAEAVRVRAVIANPDWLDLRDQRIVVLGVGAEMGPLPSVLRRGGDFAAVDLSRPEIWRRLLRPVRRRHGG